jgi:hypothetical protein
LNDTEQAYLAFVRAEKEAHREMISELEGRILQHKKEIRKATEREIHLRYGIKKGSIIRDAKGAEFVVVSLVGKHGDAGLRGRKRTKKGWHKNVQSIWGDLVVVGEVSDEEKRELGL